MNRNLITTSIEIILNNQSAWGSYIASPNFPTYHYCWLRDGSFIAYAMDLASEFDSADRFFRWVGRVVLRYQDKLESISQKIDAGLAIGKDEVLHTRFSLAGEEVTVDNTWGNFQIDGYGTWLWALAEHVRLSGDPSLLKELYEPIQITLHYLALVWKLPNYDCWEEHPEFLHPYTLATVYAGFNAISTLEQSELIKPGKTPARHLAAQVKEFLLQFAVLDGCLAKHIQPAQGLKPPKAITLNGVDSSLIGVAVPFNVFPLDHPLIVKTMQAIETNLHRPNGGVYRYKADEYYGGGEWLLLTAWLGWYHAVTGKVSHAKPLLSWIESQADANGWLAEQTSANTLAPKFIESWQKKWGPVANPLLWSHAMYIILHHAIQEHSTE